MWKGRGEGTQEGLCRESSSHQAKKAPCIKVFSYVNFCILKRHTFSKPQRVQNCLYMRVMHKEL